MLSWWRDQYLFTRNRVFVVAIRQKCCQIGDKIAADWGSSFKRKWKAHSGSEHQHIVTGSSVLIIITIAAAFPQKCVFMVQYWYLHTYIPVCVHMCIYVVYIWSKNKEKWTKRDPGSILGSSCSAIGPSKNLNQIVSVTSANTPIYVSFVQSRGNQRIWT